MANDISAVVPLLLAQGLVQLRKNCITARLLNRDYEGMAAEQGEAIKIPVPPTVTVVPVTPGPTPPSTADIAFGYINMPLNQWDEAPFYMTDKDMLTVMSGAVPLAAQSAMNALIEKVDTYILTTCYPSVYGFVGTAGTTPFGSGVGVKDATGMRTLLNKQLAPKAPRYALLDPDAEGAALGLTEFANSQFSGTYDAIAQGDLNNKLGFRWLSSQNMPTHVPNAVGTGALTTNGTQAVGATSISIAKGAGVNWSAKKGDLLLITGDPRHYVVTANTTVVQGANTSVPVSPPVRTALSSGVSITVVGQHVVNLGFHRDAFAFASRPLQRATNGLGVISLSDTDPISGLSLRLEVTREHKRTRWSFDMLYDAMCIRPELAVRLGG